LVNNSLTAWADVISVTFSNGQRTGYARGRAGFLEKLAELKRAGLIDDETGVKFTITHTFVDPPKHASSRATHWPDGLGLNIHVDLDPRFSVVRVKRAS
jgi:hypothetical protein